MVDGLDAIIRFNFEKGPDYVAQNCIQIAE